MKFFTLMVAGCPTEVIPEFDADGVPLAKRYHPDLVAQLVVYDPANPPKPPAPPPPSVADFASAVDGILNRGATAWGYDSIISAASYAVSTVPKFKAEAAAMIAWRDAVWTQAAADLAAITAGTKPTPASVAAYIATLPAQPTRPT